MQAGDSARRHYGGFDTLRIVAALSVVFLHSFAVTDSGNEGPRLSVGHLPIGFGRFGVSVFFVTSGFLVALSFDRSRAPAVFARNRFVRIWPALTALVLVSVFVLGPLVTTRSLRSYFAASLTMNYAAANLIMFFGAAFRLPGVFAHQPSAAVNGSLWTLPYELWAYVAILLAGSLGMLRRAYVPVALLCGTLMLFRFGVYAHSIPLNVSLPGMSAQQAVELLSFFFLGVVLSRFADAIDLRLVAVPGALITLLSFGIREPVLFVVGLGCLAIGLGATNTRLSAQLRRYGDPSYGIYIFSFPIQQTLYHFGIHSAAPMFALAAPISIAVGYLSWHLIESRALNRFKTGPTERKKSTVAPVVLPELPDLAAGEEYAG